MAAFSGLTVSYGPLWKLLDCQKCYVDTDDDRRFKHRCWRTDFHQRWWLGSGQWKQQRLIRRDRHFSFLWSFKRVAREYRELWLAIERRQSLSQPLGMKSVRSDWQNMSMVGKHVRFEEIRLQELPEGSVHSVYVDYMQIAQFLSQSPKHTCSDGQTIRQSNLFVVYIVTWTSLECSRDSTSAKQ